MKYSIGDSVFLPNVSMRGKIIHINLCEVIVSWNLGPTAGFCSNYKIGYFNLEIRNKCFIIKHCDLQKVCKNDK